MKNFLKLSCSKILIPLYTLLVQETPELTEVSDVDFHLECQKFSYCHNDLILTKYTNCVLTPNIKINEMYLNRYKMNTAVKSKVFEEIKISQQRKLRKIYEQRLRSNSAYVTQSTNQYMPGMARNKQEKLQEELIKKYMQREEFLNHSTKFPTLKH